MHISFTFSPSNLGEQVQCRAGTEWHGKHQPSLLPNPGEICLSSNGRELK
jgi:hypothetical protein